MTISKRAANPGWTRTIVAYPETSSTDDDRASAAAAEVAAALTAEITQLPQDGRLAVGITLGGGKIEAGWIGTLGDPATYAGALAGLLTLGTPVAGGWPDLAGATELVPQFPFALDYAATAPGAPWSPPAGGWSALVEVLARQAEPITVVVIVEAPPLDGASVAHLARSRQKRLAHSGDELRTLSVGPSPTAFGARLFVTGNALARRVLADLWFDATGLTLIEAIGIQPQAGSVEARIQHFLRSPLSAADAATLLPVPVLRARSSIVAARVAVSDHATAPAAVPGDLVVGRTRNGTPTGMAAISITQHLLVLGDIGYGKTTTMRHLLEQLWNDFRIPWLVIDPAKTEYTTMVVAGKAGLRPVRHFAIGSEPINPLIVPDGVDPASFAARMYEAFNATSALDESYPLGAAVAQGAFHQLYAQTPTPTFADLTAAMMAETHRAEMTGETARSVRASLMARLRRLTSGALGDAFAGDSTAGIDWEELSREPTVITFRGELPQNVLAPAYAFLIAAHSAWRQTHPTDVPHALVLEEAQTIFRPRDADATDALAHQLSTMRASGQGYIAVAPQPTQLDPLVVQLFPNVISHRLIQPADARLLAMLDAEPGALIALGVGEALIRVGTKASRGARVVIPPPPDDEGGPGPRNPENRRSGDFVHGSAPARQWCDACPKPCTGRRWLSLVPTIRSETSSVEGTDARIVASMQVALRTASEHKLGRGSTAHLYCSVAAATAQGQSITEAAQTVHRVRELVDDIARRTPAPASREEDT